MAKSKVWHRYLLLLFNLLILLGLIVSIYVHFSIRNSLKNDLISKPSQEKSFIKPTPTLIDRSLIIPKRKHVFQTFNNCGPAILSMAYSYLGIDKSQTELGQQLRPFQHPQGFNDDKSVTVSELSKISKDMGLISYHRPNGSPELLEQIISLQLPIIIRTWLNKNEDIGHFRLIRGYDSINHTFIQDDSLNGSDLIYTYQDLIDIWEPFGFEYLIIAPENFKFDIERVLGENADERTAWQIALNREKLAWRQNPKTYFHAFNASVAAYHLQDWKTSKYYFDAVEILLPSRMLWYQVEPLYSLFHLGEFNRLLSISDDILMNGNLAFSELYFLRGQIYENMQQIQQAKSEYYKAIKYHKYFVPAQVALDNLDS